MLIRVKARLVTNTCTPRATDPSPGNSPKHHCRLVCKGERKKKITTKGIEIYEEKLYMYIFKRIKNTFYLVSILGISLSRAVYSTLFLNPGVVYPERDTAEKEEQDNKSPFQRISP